MSKLQQYEDFLRTHFKHPKFRDQQFEIVSAVIEEKRDVLILILS